MNPLTKTILRTTGLVGAATTALLLANCAPTSGHTGGGGFGGGPGIYIPPTPHPPIGPKKIKAAPVKPLPGKISLKP